MDDQKSNKNAAPNREATPEPSAARDAQVKDLSYALPALRAECVRLFRVTTSTFDGATAGLAGVFTVAQARKIIADWQRKPVSFKTGKESE